MTDHEHFSSPFSWRYGSEAMRRLWGELHRRRLMRQVWLALAEAQLEAARIKENKDVTTVDVLDIAVPPDRRSFPRRGLMTGLALVVSSLIGVLIALLFAGSLTVVHFATLRGPVAVESLLSPDPAPPGTWGYVFRQVDSTSWWFSFQISPAPRRS